MPEGSRLDEIAETVGDMRERVARIETHLEHICKTIEPMENKLVERCKSEIRAWGWKSITTLVTAVLSGLGGLLVSLMRWWQ